MSPADAFPLVLQRDVDIPLEAVWRAWTDPSWITRWFTPAPWKTPHCELDLRPGGRFFTVMQSPEGEDFPQEGCFLEVQTPTRLVWTSALRAGYAPAPPDAFPAITVVISLEPVEGGTRYVATVLHASAEDREKHAAMNFHEGWGAALDQLVVAVKEHGAISAAPSFPEA